MALVLRRKRIRDVTVAILKNAGTAAGARVYPTHIVPWRRELPLPAIGVSTLHERSTPLGAGSSGPFQLRQSLELAIECVVELESPAGQTGEGRLALDAQDPLDALCGEVTKALFPNPLWRDDFEGLEGWETRGDAGRPEDTDRRTMAATILATINYTCIAGVNVDDFFCSAVIDLDAIDPAADPNIKYPGPDGRIEVSLTIPREGDPPLCPPYVDPRKGDAP